MSVTCAYCGRDTVDAHQIELCRDCCACREDLAGEVLAIAESMQRFAEWSVHQDDARRRASTIALALTQLAARLSRTGEAES